MSQLYETITNALPVTDPVVTFAIVMVIILIAPMAMRRMQIPGLIGIIIAGAIIGPSAMGLLERDRTIELLGTVGLLYLMFMAGLSMDLQQFLRERKRSIGFGFISFIVPQTLGMLAGLYLLGYEPLTAVLLGSIVGSHTLLGYPIAKRLGITKNPAVTMSMGGTIATDALALTVLAVVAAMTAGEAGPLFWVQFIGLVGAYVALALFGLPRLGRWFFRNIQERGDVDFIFLMAVLFLSAVLSEFVGLAPIVGAFLAGLVMNRLVPDTGPLMNRVHFVGDALFIPFFLLSVGMLVDFGVLFGGLAVWGIATVFFALVLIGKFLAAGAMRLAFDLTYEQGWTVFGLTIPQAAATLAVTLVGFELGLFDEAAVNAVVILMLGTCLLGPWLVERYGRAIALAEAREAFSSGDAPQRILVPLANPANADALMDIAFMLRGTASKEPVYPLAVARDAGNVEAQVAESEKLLSHAVVHSAGAGVPVVPLTRVDLNVANGIERAVRELRISMLVIGWNGQITTRQRVLGSILDQVLQSLSQMTLICRVTETPLNTTNRIVLMIPPLSDHEPGFMDATRTVKVLAKALGTQMTVIATKGTMESVQPRLAEQKPELKFESVPLNSWSSLASTLREQVEESDVLVLLSSRVGRLSWTPELGRLAPRLAQSYQEQNLIIVYPSELPPEPVRRETTGPLAAMPTDCIALNLTSDTFEGAIDQLLTPHFGENARALGRVVHEVTSAGHQSIEQIAAGVAIVHCHATDVEKATALIGLSKEGVPVANMTDPAYVLLVLLTPKRTPPEQHLRTLSEIARQISQPNVIQSLHAAESVDDVRAALSPGTAEESD